VRTRGQVGRFPIDHVIPRKSGGATDLSNLALACPHCNATKWKHTHGVDLESGGTVPLFNPRAASWDQHFEWSEEDLCLIKGLTPCGRATFNRLQLNHPDILLTRRLLTALEIMATESL
jgi:hypothetical protein